MINIWGYKEILPYLVIILAVKESFERFSCLEFIFEKSKHREAGLKHKQAFSIKARSGQNHDNKKLHRKSILIPLQQILLWTRCVFLSSLNNTFLSVLVIIFSNKSYFCFNHRNNFFIHTMNYFSVVLRIIFVMCIKHYFLIRPRII